MTGTCARGPYRGKRAFDLAILAAAAIPSLALGLVCAVAVKMSGPGPILFRQQRAGIAGRPFRVWKFRTMLDAPAPGPFPDAERITGTGRWLRRLSLDELPQLLNVAIGEMSIVGPRPTLLYQVQRYTADQRGRLAVRPGVTGLAQVRGRNEISWARRIEIDLEYVRRQSPLLDLKILALTIGAVVRGSGVEGHPHEDPIAADPPPG